MTQNKRLTLFYLWHSCFLLRSSRCAILFDYWATPSLPDLDHLPGLEADTPLYIVVSHHHKDHFTAQLLTHDFGTRPVRYILSHDTAKAVRYMLREGTTYAGPRPKPETVTVLRNYESYSDDLLAIHAFGSTDIGNSYVVEIEGKTILHAGDLNFWCWKEESTKAEIAAAERAFLEKTSKIKEQYSGFDLAMFPVDSRMGKDYCEGARMFVREFRVARFVPMHFCLADETGTLEQRAAAVAAFSDYANPDYGDYIALLHPLDRLSFP